MFQGASTKSVISHSSKNPPTRLIQVDKKMTDAGAITQLTIVPVNMNTYWRYGILGKKTTYGRIPGAFISGIPEHHQVVERGCPCNSSE